MTCTPKLELKLSLQPVNIFDGINGIEHNACRGKGRQDIDDHYPMCCGDRVTSHDAQSF